jgi:8-oxo-dGTP diphosphatase
VDCRAGRELPSRNSVPRVDVRVVLFTVSDGRLLVGLQDRGECRALPLRAPGRDESLDEVGTSILDEHIGVTERYQEQLYSISHRSEGDWTVIVTSLALALADAADSARNSVSWFSVSEPPELNAVDRMIVDYGLRRLRAKLGYTTIAFHLLPRNFTLTELQAVYEAVLDRQVDKRNFRRRSDATGLLEGTAESRRKGSHRPARLYWLRTDQDAKTYLTPAWTTQAERKAANL